MKARLNVIITAAEDIKQKLETNDIGHIKKSLDDIKQYHASASLDFEYLKSLEKL